MFISSNICSCICYPLPLKIALTELMMQQPLHNQWACIKQRKATRQITTDLSKTKCTGDNTMLLELFFWCITASLNMSTNNIFGCSTAERERGEATEIWLANDNAVWKNAQDDCTNRAPYVRAVPPILILYIDPISVSTKVGAPQVTSLNSKFLSLT